MSKREERKEQPSGPFGLKLDPRLLEMLAKFQEIELEDFEMEVGDLELWFQPGSVAVPPTLKRVAQPAPVTGKPVKIIEVDFTPPVEKYPG
ncbi:MAG: hypothetical protein QXH85_05305, partial [Candidatus Bathyarchaeia archaeon]